MFDEKLNGQNTQSKEGVEKLRKMLEITEIEKERDVYEHMRLLCTRFLSTSPLIFSVCTRVLVMGRQSFDNGEAGDEIEQCVCVCARAFLLPLSSHMGRLFNCYQFITKPTAI